MLKRKVSKSKVTLKQLLSDGRKTLVCKECEKHIVEVASDIAAVTCAYCVQRQVAPPDNIKPKEKSEFPRGWALKATYIHTDGRIFEKGVDTGRKYEPTKEVPKKVKKKVVKKAVSKKKTPKRRK